MKFFLRQKSKIQKIHSRSPMSNTFLHHPARMIVSHLMQNLLSLSRVYHDDTEPMFVLSSSVLHELLMKTPFVEISMDKTQQQILNDGVNVLQNPNLQHYM